MTLSIDSRFLAQAEGGLVLVDAPEGQVSAAPVFSQQSVRARHSTLFEAFRFTATPVYNFFTEDETISRPLDPTLSLDELPRYVTLRWSPAPSSIVTTAFSKTGRPATMVSTSSATLTVAEAKSSLANGFISPGVIDAKVAVPITTTVRSFDEDSFLETSDQSTRDAVNARLQVSQAVTTSTSVGVSFVDPSIAGLLDDSRIRTTANQIDLNVASSLTKLLASFEVLSEFNQDVPQVNPPPDAPADPGTATFMYIGYTIERYLNNPDGSISLDATFDVDDVRETKLVDRSVAYGKTYSYRIRTIMQWTHPSNITFDGLSLTDRHDIIDGQLVSSFVGGDWSPWVVASIFDLVTPDPPDELTVVPRSHRSTIRITWKLPDDSQRDINSFHLLRAPFVAGKIGEWVELGVFTPKNGWYDDRDVLFYDRDKMMYVYAMYSTTVHDERSTLSEQIAAGVLTRFSGRELPLQQISARGVPIGTYGRGSRIPEPSDMEIPTGSKRVRLYSRIVDDGTKRLGIRDYVVQVQSLTTGERVPVPVRLLPTDVRPTAKVRGA